MINNRLRDRVSLSLAGVAIGVVLAGGAVGCTRAVANDQVEIQDARPSAGERARHLRIRRQLIEGLTPNMTVEQVAAIPERIAQVIKQHEITADWILEELHRSPPLESHWLLALGTSHTDLTLEKLRAFVLRDGGIWHPWIVSYLFLNKVPNQEVAFETGFDLLSRPGRLGMLGHSLLTFASLRVVGEHPSTWPMADWTRPVSVEAWEFARPLAKAHPHDLLRDGLVTLRKQTGEPPRQAVRTLNRLVFQAGPATRGKGFPNSTPEELAEWAASTARRIEFRDIQEVSSAPLVWIDSMLTSEGTQR